MDLAAQTIAAITGLAKRDPLLSTSTLLGFSRRTATRPSRQIVQFRSFFNRDHQIFTSDIHINNDIGSNIDRAVSSDDNPNDERDRKALSGLTPNKQNGE